jgi:transposase
LKPNIQPEWIERYRKRVDAYRLPKSKAKRDALAQVIGQDGYCLLTAVYDETAPPELRALPSIETLRRVWVQQFYADEDGIHWRTKKKWGQPPAHRMIASPDEPDARYAAKYSIVWTGYKVHLTETCDPDQPRLITHVETTPATTHDVKVTEKIHNDLASKDLLPDEHLVDGGYLEADLLLSSHNKGVDLIGPMLADKSWQAKTEGAFDHSQFHIDWERMQATCPNGKTSVYQMEGATRRSSANIHFTFSAADCRPCPFRSKCTRAKAGGRTLTIYPREQYEILQAARERQSTEEFEVLYGTRAGIEGTISQAVNVMGIRCARYRGMAKTHLQNLATAAAINLVRVANWMMGHQPETTRISPFTALALQT